MFTKVWPSLAFAFVALVFALGLAACGGGDEEAAPPAEPVEAAPPPPEPEEAPPPAAEAPAEAPPEPASEPEGAPPAEENAAEPSETWEYVALGDSLAQFGIWPGEYAAYIEEDLGVAVELHKRGLPGRVDASILDLIRSDDELRTLIGQAEVITVQGGINSLSARRAEYESGFCGGDDSEDCLREMLAEFQTNWDAILDEIVGLRGSEDALIRALSGWNWVLDRLREENPNAWRTLIGYGLGMNEHVLQSASERGIAVVDVNAAFHGPEAENPAPQDLLSDGVHYSDAGSTLLADLLRDLGYEYAEPAAQEEPVATEGGIIVELRELNDSGLAGSATLVPAGADTEVAVRVDRNEQGSYAIFTGETCESVAQATPQLAQEEGLQAIFIAPGVVEESGRFFVALEQFQADDFVLAIVEATPGGPGGVGLACGEVAQ